MKLSRTNKAAVRDSGPCRLEKLEGRRMLSVGDEIVLPLVFLDIPGSASTTPVAVGVKELHITATGANGVTTGGVDVPFVPPVLMEIFVNVNDDGTLNSSVAGDDLRVFNDNDTNGTFSLGDTLLLSGEVTLFNTSGITVEFKFDINPGTPWASDPAFFGRPGGPADAGVQLDLSDPLAGPGPLPPLDFATGFTDFSPKGVLGALPIQRGDSATIGFWQNRNGQA